MPLLAQADPIAEALTGMDAVKDANGVAITVTGLLIVFVALTAISIFIAALPKVLQVMGPYLPEIESHHDRPAGGGPPAKAGDVDPRVVAAIGWAIRNSPKSK